MDFIKNRARKRFGERLKAAIAQSGRFQYKVAELVGVEPPNISRWTQGQTYPSPEHYEKLKEVLGVGDDWFNDDDITFAAKKNNDESKSDLIVSIVSILPTLNEDQLRSVLRSATGLSSGPSALRANKSALPK